MTERFNCINAFRDRYPDLYERMLEYLAIAHPDRPERWGWQVKQVVREPMGAMITYLHGPWALDIVQDWRHICLWDGEPQRVTTFIRLSAVELEPFLNVVITT